MPDGITTGHSTLATSYSRTAYRRTTIGAAAFHCRVRNGNGWDHCAIVTRGPSRAGAVSVLRTEKPTRISGDGVRRGGRPTISLSKEHDFQSPIRNRKSAISSGSLISTYRKL